MLKAENKETAGTVAKTRKNFDLFIKCKIGMKGV